MRARYINTSSKVRLYCTITEDSTFFFKFLLRFEQSRISVVKVEIRIQVGKNEVFFILLRGKLFLSSRKSHKCLCVPHSLLFSGEIGAVSPGAKQPEHKTNH